MVNIFTAIKRGDIVKVRELIHSGIDINKTDRWGRTPLFFAYSYLETDIVKLLIEAGADVNKEDKDGDIPLHLACLRGESNIAKLLIDAGADINKANKDWNTPLLIACIYKSINIVKLLIEKGADITDDIIEKAKNDEFIPEINKLIMEAIENNIFYAIENDDIDTVKKLIDSGEDINKGYGDNGNTPLIHAIYYYQLDIIKLLIDSGADINKGDYEDNTPLHVASYHDGGDLDIVELLIEKGADVNKETNGGITALHNACNTGDIDIVTLLIDAGADINKINNLDDTPLSIACDEGHEDIVRLLIEKGADITDDIIEKAENNEFIPEINKLILEANRTVENNASNIVLNQVNRPVVTGNVSPSQCYNPYMTDYQNITSDLTIFYQLKADGTVASIKCIDEDAFDYYTKDKKNVFYKCNDTVKTGALNIRRADTVGEPMRLMRFDTMIYVQAKQARAIQKGRMYVLEPTTERVGRIVSQSVIEGGSLVGASHCGPATADVLYNIKEVKEPQAGGKRRTRRLRSRAKVTRRHKK